MKFNQFTQTCLLSTLLLSAAAKAQAPADKDFYVGTSIGAMVIVPNDYKDSESQATQARASAGLFAGARLGALPLGGGLPVFVEVGYQDIARHTVSYQIANGTSDLTARGHSAYAAAKVHFWNPGDFSLYGKLGVARNSVSASTPAGQSAIPINGNGTGLLVGFGGQYDFDNRVSLRGEFTSYGKSSSKSSAGGLSLGVTYRF